MVKRLNMTTRKPRGYWTKERLHKEALKYKTRGEFMKGSSGAYDRAKDLKILDLICTHMKSGRILWNEKKIHKEALKYNSREEFKKGSKGAYQRARIIGILDKVCSHMKLMRVSWTDELIKEKALKYNHRSDFQKYSRSAYRQALSRKIMDKVCSHMTPKNDNQKRGLYSYEFEDKSVYVGLTWNYKERFASHACRPKSAVFKKVKTGIDFKVIKHGRRVQQSTAIKREVELIEKYKKDGWSILNVAKAGSLGGTRRKWTEDKVHKEALKYKTRGAFKKGSVGAYDRAKKDGILDKVCKHMKNNHN